MNRTCKSDYQTLVLHYYYYKFLQKSMIIRQTGSRIQIKHKLDIENHSFLFTFAFRI